MKLSVILVSCLIFLTTSISSFWMASDVEDYSPIKRIVIASCLVYFTFYIIKQKYALSDILKNNKLFLVITSLMFISVLWSEDPQLTIKRLLLTLAVNIVAILLVYNTPRLKSVLLYYYVSVIILSLILMLFSFGWMQYENKGMVPKGIFFHKNYFGRFLCFAAIFFMYLKDKPIFSKVFLSISCILIMLTKSTTSLFALIASLLIYTLFLKRKVFYALLGLAIFFILIAQLYSALNNVNVVDTATQFILDKNDKDMTFTGRTRLWELLITDGMHRHPLLGAGYSAYFKGYKTRWLELMDEFAPGHAHNSYLQIFLELGLIGFSLTLLLILVTLVKCIRYLYTTNQRSNMFICTSFLVSLIFGYFEPGILGCGDIVGLSFILGVLYHQKNDRVYLTPA